MSDQTYQYTNVGTKNINFHYIGVGAYVEATDGTLYRSSEWASSGKVVNSVVVLTDNVKFRIAPIDAIKKPVHNAQTGGLSSYLSAKTGVDGKADYDGVGNTAKIIQFNIAKGTNTTTYAAPYCNAYTFPDGVTTGFLPSGGQLWTAAQNYQSVQSCMTAIGLAIKTIDHYRSSTYSGTWGGNECTAVIDISRSLYEDNDKTDGIGDASSTLYWVLPFGAYE